MGIITNKTDIENNISNEINIYIATDTSKINRLWDIAYNGGLTTTEPNVDINVNFKKVTATITGNACIYKEKYYINDIKAYRYWLLGNGTYKANKLYSNGCGSDTLYSYSTSTSSGITKNNNLIGNVKYANSGDISLTNENKFMLDSNVNYNLGIPPCDYGIMNLTSNPTNNLMGIYFNNCGSNAWFRQETINLKSELKFDYNTILFGLLDDCSNVNSLYKNIVFELNNNIHNTSETTAFNFTLINSNYTLEQIKNGFDYTNYIKNIYPTSLNYSLYNQYYIGNPDYDVDYISLQDYNFAPYNPNIYFEGIPVTENYESAINYIENGQIDDTFTIEGVTNDTPITEVNNNGDFTTQIDNTVFGNDTTIGYGNGNKLYLLGSSTLKEVINWIWTNDDILSILTDQLTNIYGNITNSLLSIRYFPLDYSQFALISQSKLTFGRLTYDDNDYDVISGTKAPITLCSYFLNRKFNNYLDYAPYTIIKLYLPFVGYCTLDTNLLIDNMLNIKASIDYISGTITYYILRNDTLVSEFSGKISIDIPFSIDNAVSLYSNISNQITQFSVNALSNPSSIALNCTKGLNLLNSDVKVSSGSSGINNIVGCQNIQLLIKYPTFNRPKLYSKTVGYPTNENYKLSTIKGFVQIDKPYFTNIDNKITKNEMNLLTNLLKEGVII